MTQFSPFSDSMHPQIHLCTSFRHSSFHPLQYTLPPFLLYATRPILPALLKPARWQHKPFPPVLLFCVSFSLSSRHYHILLLFSPLPAPLSTLCLHYFNHPAHTKHSLSLPLPSSVLSQFRLVVVSIYSLTKRFSSTTLIGFVYVPIVQPQAQTHSTLPLESHSLY